MSKINFRFTLLEARFPELYTEAENKIEAGVAPKDVMADWLNRLACYERGMSATTPPEKPIDNDVDFAASIMADLD